MTALHCFHCDELINQVQTIEQQIHGKMQSFCCLGCASIAGMIDSNGLVDFYDFRSQSSAKANNEKQNSYLIYDKTNVQQQYFVAKNAKTSHIQLLVEDIRCAACIWLIKARLSRVVGVSKIEVDSLSKIVSFDWTADTTLLSKIMQKLDDIGFPCTPYCIENEIVQKNNYRNDILKRLGVAGLGMMQTMMFATGLYLGDSELTNTFNTSNDLASSDRALLQWVSLIVTSFVLWYSAAPFYKNAYRSVLVGKIGIDMPISLALFIAYGSSLYNILNNHPHVYFDTVTMFTFLILLGRLAEAQTRNFLARTLSSSKNKIPILARRVGNEGDAQSINGNPSSLPKEDWLPIVELAKYDTVLVKVGETVPIDGIIIEGDTWFDQSFITGESNLVVGNIGTLALAGSINTHAPIKLRTENLSGQRLIDQIIQFKQSGTQNKPHLEMQLDTVAKYFSLAVILVASFVYLGWTFYQPEKALLVTLSVLVISCPCALSLAVPTAQACTQAILNKLGVAVAHHHFLETLLKTTDVLFDKTGTLTEGKVTISQVNFLHREQFLHSGEALNKVLDKPCLLAFIASLEAESEHPIAQAFLPYLDPAIKATNIKYVVGEGVSGDIDGLRYYVGSPLFIDENVPSAKAKFNSIDYNIGDQPHLIVASNSGIIASILTQDQTRNDAHTLVNYLHDLDIQTHILSGDPSDKSTLLAKQLGINNVQQGMLAQNKMGYVESLHQQGRISLMIGDGINDAPVLSVAHNSIAMGSGSDLSRVSADAVLINNQLSSLVHVFKLAKQHKAVITSNIYWALGYNVITIPMAVFGFIPPYLAAIGMSLSSLVVLWNATRLLNKNTFEKIRHESTKQLVAN
jgi:P-type Cu2+ transporter